MTDGDPVNPRSVPLARVAALALLVFRALACAALQQAGGAAAQPDDVPEATPTDSVFVRDSPAAWDAFQNGVRMERLKEWSKAADFYQEVVEKYRDRVVPAGQDADHHTSHYTSIVRLVQQQLAKWPPEGLETYRGRYETPAQTMLNDAQPGDAGVLHRVFDRYFVTESGKTAGMRLMDICLETGEYRAAAAIGERLVALHPGLGPQSAAVMYRIALALHFAGDAQAALAWQGKLAAGYPVERGTVRGKEVVLAESLAAEIGRPLLPQRSDPASADSWPMPWGDPSRSRLSAAQGRPGVRLFNVALSKPSFPGVSLQQRMGFDHQFNQWSDDGFTLGVMPVTDRGEMFFQDGQRVYAVSIESGLPLPRWLDTYPGTGQYAIANVWGSARTQQLTLAITDQEVVGVMGQPDRQGIMNGVASPTESRLVCLNRENGREKWVTLLSQLPQEAAGLRELQMTGSPLVVGDNVLVIGRAGKQVQFEDCYILGFDLKTGKYRWSCYVASANTGGWAGMPTIVGENISHLAYADGLVYVQTNLGALAAVDPYGATLVWVDIYPAQLGNPQANNPFVPQIALQQSQSNGPLPWTHNPVIVSNGVLYTLPRGGKNLLVYDAASGMKLKSVPLSDLRDCDTLLGIVGDRVVMSGQKDVLSFDWKKYDPSKFTEDDFTWLQSLPEPIRGRGFIAGNLVYVPARDRLWWIDMSTHKVVGAYPRHPRSWDESEGPGNVLVTSDHVILAGARSVDGYTDLSVAKSKLEQQVAGAVNDPEPRLRYAELMFVAGDPDAALQRLDESIGLLGGAAALQAGPTRDEIYSDSLAFAQKLSADSRVETKARANKFFDRAALAAFSPLQQVRYRLSRARFDEASQDGADAVKLYEEVLLDGRLRNIPLVDEGSAVPTQAGAVAEKAIAILIKADASVYAPYEAAAEQAAAAARSAADDVAEKLLDVAQSYPNSSVAAQAMLDAAGAYETAGNPRLAVQVVRQLYFKDRTGPLRARVLETMARNYLAMPDRTDIVEAAAARLAQGAQLPGDPMLEKPLRLPNGRVLGRMRFSEALEEVRKYDGEQALRALPDFHLPIPRLETASGGRRREWPKPFLDPSPQRVISGVRRLILPLRDSSRPDRIVALGDNGKLEIFAPAQIEPLATADWPAGDEPQKCAWLGGNLLVWGSSTLSLLQESGGAPVWTLDSRQFLPLEISKIDPPPPAPAPVAVWRGRMFGRGQVVVRGNGRLVLNAGGVQVLGGNAPPPLAARGPDAGPERIVDVKPVADRVLLTTSAGRLLCTELINGKPVWQTRLSDRPIDRLVANDDFTVVRVADDASVRLAALDTFSGESRGSMSFNVESQRLPINLALAADGTLVYTLPDMLCLKSLYTPWPDPSDREIPGAGGLTPFRNAEGAASAPDQLLIAEGRILALADNGPQKIVRVHSLETGNPVSLRFASPQGNQEVDRVLSAGSSWNVSLRVVGPHLYVFGPEGTASYNLDRPAESWSNTVEDSPLNVKATFVGQQFVVMLDDATPPPPPAAAVTPTPLYTLRAFGRYPISETNRAESGRFDFQVDITDPGILTGAWQAVEGGFYYLTADHKLHMLLGSRDSSEKN